MPEVFSTICFTISILCLLILHRIKSKEMYYEGYDDGFLDCGYDNGYDDAIHDLIEALDPCERCENNNESNCYNYYKGCRDDTMISYRNILEIAGKVNSGK